MNALTRLHDLRDRLPVWGMVTAASALLAAGAEDWPQWRGPNRDAHAPAQAPVPTRLPPTANPVWRLSIGPGHSSPIVVGDKLIYLDEQDHQEVAHGILKATGQSIWRQPFGAAYGDEWGSGPRSTPFADGDRVYVQSCRGEFVCLHLRDGRELWRASFERDFGVKFVGSRAARGTAARRGNNGSGVIDGNQVIVPVGSTDGASLVSFDKRTGQVLWRSGNDEAAYSSLVIATLAGVRQVVAFTADALLGAQLSDGQILWRVPLKTAAKRHAATPVVFGNRVTVNSHTIGLVCLEVTRTGPDWNARPAWINKDLRINIATPVLAGDSLYCQGPDKDFVCVAAQDGRVRWTQPGFGRGKKDYSSAMVLGDKLLVLTESGTLFLLQGNEERYVELGRLQVCGNTWSSPAYSNGKLYVRDARSLFCLDLLAAPAAKD